MQQQAYEIIEDRVHLDRELSLQLGIPSGQEAWRFIIARAIMDTGNFSAALTQMDNAAVHFLAHLLDVVEAADVSNPGVIMPAHLTAEFHIGLADLRERTLSEAARRGVTLVPWTTTRQ